MQRGKIPNPVMHLYNPLFLSTEEPRRQRHERSQLAAVSCMGNIPLSRKQTFDRSSYLQLLIRDDILEFGELGETRK